MTNKRKEFRQALDELAVCFHHDGSAGRDAYSQESMEAEHRVLRLYDEALRDAERYRALNTPEIHDFLAAVEREALYQRDRWGAQHDAGKTDADWFWLIGYLAGKALHKPEKMLHHIITTAAACLNWHAARVGAHTAMRPGIADPDADRGGAAQVLDAREGKR